MTPRLLPDVARSLLKAVVVAMANAGILTQADADYLIANLGLRDA
jgi:hypothetical protein